MYPVSTKSHSANKTVSRKVQLTKQFILICRYYLLRLSFATKLRVCARRESERTSDWVYLFVRLVDLAVDAAPIRCDFWMKNIVGSGCACIQIDMPILLLPFAVQSKCVFFEFCETEISFVRLGDVCIALHIQINNINRMEFSRAWWRNGVKMLLSGFPCEGAAILYSSLFATQYCS